METEFPATRADTAPGRWRGTDTELLTEDVRGIREEAEYPVPILGTKEEVVIVVVDKEFDTTDETPLKDIFSCWSLA